MALKLMHRTFHCSRNISQEIKVIGMERLELVSMESLGLEDGMKTYLIPLSSLAISLLSTRYKAGGCGKS